MLDLEKSTKCFEVPKMINLLQMCYYTRLKTAELKESLL